MSAEADYDDKLRDFLTRSHFAAHGAVVTDLDGTAVHEDQGRIAIPKTVEYALKELQELGRPLVLNTLRFPLSVLRTFGRDWCRLTRAPIPAVTLNGSLIGTIFHTEQDEMVFEELAAFPMSRDEIESLLTGVERFVADGIKDFLLFYYPRDWRIGEVIWTPVPEKVLEVKEKYVSASAVTAVELPKLREQMLSEDICMVFLLVDVPQDRLMAYQHTRRDNFVTHEGVDKLFGAQQIAARLGVDLSHSIGAGDTEMDRFLSGAGLALHVGPLELPFRGLIQTLRLRNSTELGEVLFRLAELQRQATA